jgi:hypothetical protein
MIYLGVFAMLSSAGEAGATCLPVKGNTSGFQIDKVAQGKINEAGLSYDDVIQTLNIVASYETGGCWAGAVGNFDEEYLSLGVMQWNLGMGSLQKIIVRFRGKFPNKNEFYSYIDRHMHVYGRQFVDFCTAIPISENCKKLVLSNGDSLSPGFKSELDTLFNDSLVRQVQMDYFIRAYESVLDDLKRVYSEDKPEPWQVAWLLDIKVQQKHPFPTNSNIAKVKKLYSTLNGKEREEWLMAPFSWYKSSCETKMDAGITNDCSYNLAIWPDIINDSRVSRVRHEAYYYTFLVSRSANATNGIYQADTFQRRATIALGKGSVHGDKHDFVKQLSE